MIVVFLPGLKPVKGIKIFGCNKSDEMKSYTKEESFGNRVTTTLRMIIVVVNMNTCGGNGGCPKQSDGE